MNKRDTFSPTRRPSRKTAVTLRVSLLSRWETGAFARKGLSILKRSERRHMHAGEPSRLRGHGLMMSRVARTSWHYQQTSVRYPTEDSCEISGDRPAGLILECGTATTCSSSTAGVLGARSDRNGECQLLAPETSHAGRHALSAPPSPARIGV